MDYFDQATSWVVPYSTIRRNKSLSFVLLVAFQPRFWLKKEPRAGKRLKVIQSVHSAQVAILIPISLIGAEQEGIFGLNLALKDPPV